MLLLSNFPDTRWTVSVSVSRDGDRFSEIGFFCFFRYFADLAMSIEVDLGGSYSTLDWSSFVDKSRCRGLIDLGLLLPLIDV